MSPISSKSGAARITVRRNRRPAKRCGELQEHRDTRPVVVRAGRASNGVVVRDDHDRLVACRPRRWRRGSCPPAPRRCGTRGPPLDAPDRDSRERRARLAGGGAGVRRANRHRARRTRGDHRCEPSPPGRGAGCAARAGSRRGSAAGRHRSARPSRPRRHGARNPVRRTEARRRRAAVGCPPSRVQPTCPGNRWYHGTPGYCTGAHTGLAAPSACTDAGQSWYSR